MMTARSSVVLVLSLLGPTLIAATARAQSAGDLSKVPAPAELLAPHAVLANAARVSFLEGPAFDAADNLYFSDIIGNRILKMSPAGAVSVFRADSGRTNGNTFDAEGRLISCEGAEQGSGGRRRIVRTDITKPGEVTVLTERYQGKRYNSPNDACVDTRGRIYFSDPYYGEDRSSLEMGAEAVYRIDPDGAVTRIVSQPEIERPNGVVVTPDARTLYVADSNGRPGGNRKIWAFDLSEGGTLSRQRLLFDFGKGRGADGMRIDMKGNLWVAGGILLPRTAGETADVPAGVYVISPEGKLLGKIAIPEDVTTNLAFGGPSRSTLFVTSGNSLFKIQTAVQGYALYPPPLPAARP